MNHIARGYGAALAAAGLLVGMAPAARADHDYKCASRSTSVDGIQFCVVEDHDHYVYGQIRYYAVSTTTQTLTGTIVVEQCSGLGTNCATITATPVNRTASNGIWSAYMYTSNKPTSFGHVYRVCTSVSSTTGSSWTYVCTPFNAYGG